MYQADICSSVMRGGGIMTGKYALLIGTSRYEDSKLSKLRAPESDVQRLSAVLGRKDIGNFDVKLSINEPCQVVRRHIARLFVDRSMDDLVLLYFTGHGVRSSSDGHLYLATGDTEINLLSATAIPASFISLQMDDCRAKSQVLILDCCHSGAFQPGAKGTVGGTVGTGSAFEGRGYGRVVLTATDALQSAWEGDRVIGNTPHSLFTHYLIQGLNHGEADLNLDGAITVDELYDYVYEQVIMQTKQQTPSKYTYKAQGTYVVAKNPNPKPERLPQDLEDDLRDILNTDARKNAILRLGELLHGDHRGLALAARERLEKLVQDDSRQISTLAIDILKKAPSNPSKKTNPPPRVDEPSRPPTQPDVNRIEPSQKNIWMSAAQIIGGVVLACIILMVIAQAMQPKCGYIYDPYYGSYRYMCQ
jgi:hypothetical protein